MSYEAHSIHIGRDGYKFYFSWVDKSDSVYRSVEMNVDQLALMLKQAAELVSQCRIAANGTE